MKVSLINLFIYFLSPVHSVPGPDSDIVCVGVRNIRRLRSPHRHHAEDRRPAEEAPQTVKLP